MWVDSLVKARQEISDEILAQNLAIAIKAGDVVLDRLENGDEKLVWDKEKKEHVIKRVMPSGKDSMIISGVAQDKGRVQMGLATSIVGKSDDIPALIKYFREVSEKWDEKQVRVVSTQDKDE